MAENMPTPQKWTPSSNPVIKGATPEVHVHIHLPIASGLIHQQPSTPRSEEVVEEDPADDPVDFEDPPSRTALEAYRVDRWGQPLVEQNDTARDEQSRHG